MYIGTKEVCKYETCKNYYMYMHRLAIIIILLSII